MSGPVSIVFGRRGTNRIGAVLKEIERGEAVPKQRKKQPEPPQSSSTKSAAPPPQESTQVQAQGTLASKGFF